MGNIQALFGGISLSSTLAIRTPADFNFLSSFFDWTGILSFLLYFFFRIIYAVVRFVLNIVDFFQFFARRLVGIDYWISGNPSLDTLGDSDVIFRFLYNPTLQRVFRIMVGVFAVLLIVFTIVAIVKSEYDYAVSGDVKNSDKTDIFRRALKAIALVVLIPVMLVMGILASNAILASLVNALNVNNRLTLGGQIFTASAYSANRYRIYATNGNRKPATNRVAVTANRSDPPYNEETIFISTAVETIIPSDYGKNNLFYGYQFKAGDKWYLYKLSSEDHDKYQNHYDQYFRDVLECSSYQYLSGANINAADKNSDLMQAAYNTWYYNKIFKDYSMSFDKSVTEVDGEQIFTSDAGTMYSAKKYQNCADWAAYNDGGADGFVALDVEYLVMADMIDFMMTDAVETAVVNIYNPLIRWDYANNASGYVDGNFIHGIADPNEKDLSFIVNYLEKGTVLYEPKHAQSEDQGAIFIMAYYDNGYYVPVINNKTYVDGNGTSHTFVSDVLDFEYSGLIVARGLMDSTISTSAREEAGFPTIIDSSYVLEDGSMVKTGVPYYAEAESERYLNWFTKIVEFDLPFDETKLYKDGASFYLKEKLVGDMSNINGVIGGATNTTITNNIASSLPRTLTYGSFVSGNFQGGATWGRQTDTLNNITWTYCHPIKVSENGSEKSYLVFLADKSITASVDNNQFVNKTEGLVTELNNKKVPLYCFVQVDWTGAGNGEDGQMTLNLSFAYGQVPIGEYTYAKDTWLKNDGKAALTLRGDSLYGSYNIDSGSTQNRDGLKARFIQFGDGAALVELEENVTCPSWQTVYINPNDFEYTNPRGSLEATEGNIFNSNSVEYDTRVYRENVSSTGESNMVDFRRSYLIAEVLKYAPAYDTLFNVSEMSYTVFGTGESYNSGKTYPLTDQGLTPNINSSLTVEDNTSIVIYLGINKDGAPFNIEYGSRQYPVRFALTISKVDGKITITPYDYYALSIAPETIIEVKSAANYYHNEEYMVKIDNNNLRLFNIYVDSAVKSGTTGKNNNIEIYRFLYNGQYYYGRFQKTLWSATGSSSSKKGQTCFEAVTGDTYPDNPDKFTELYQIKINYYDALAFNCTDGKYQFNPESGEAEKLTEPVETETYMTRRTNIIVGSSYVSKDSENKYIYRGTINIDKNDAGSATYILGNFMFRLDSDNLQNEYIDKVNANEIGIFEHTYRLILGANTYDSLPYYEKSAGEVASEFSNMQNNIRFYREYCSYFFNWRFDFNFNFLNPFGEGDTRLKIGMFNGASNNKTKVLFDSWANGRNSINYNFGVTGEYLDYYYNVSALNWIILIFATVLVLMVLGQAVWGLVGRIFDIVLYFIIMPGVMSTLPLDNGSRLKSWQGGLVKKVLGAYGVMIGLNFFFLLVPGIRSASQLFGPDDLLTNLAPGNWLSLLSYKVVNNIVYMLFLLVALTLIRTLPATLSQILGSEDAYANGKTVKGNVEGMVNDVGRHVSGQAAMDTVDKFLGKKDDKGKRHGGYFKDFLPGSAVYDSWRKNHPKKHEQEENTQEPPPPIETPPITPPTGETPPTTELPTETPEPIETHRAETGEPIVPIASGVNPEGEEGDDFNPIAADVTAAEPEPAEKLSRNERKLKKLQDRQAADIQAQSNGEYTKLHGKDLAQAVSEYNDGRDNSSKIFDENDEDILSAAFEMYNNEKGIDLNNMSSSDKNYGKMKKEALANYKNELIWQSWNASHQGDGLEILSDAEMQARIDADKEAANQEMFDLTAKEMAGTITGDEMARLSQLRNTDYDAIYNDERKKNMKAAKSVWNQEQKDKQLVASTNYNSKLLDEAVNEQAEKVALEQAGQLHLSRQNKKFKKIGDHLAEQAAAQAALDAVNKKSVPEMYANLSDADRRKLVEKYNKEHGKEGLFSELDFDSQYIAIADMLADQLTQEQVDAKERLDSANDAVTHDEHVTKFGSERRYRKFEKAKATFGVADEGEARKLSERAIKDLSKKGEAKAIAESRNAELNGKNAELDKQMAVQQNVINRIKGELEQAERYKDKAKTKELKAQLSTAVKNYNESASQKDANAKRIAKNMSIIDDFDVTANNTEVKGSKRIKHNLEKSRKTLIDQLDKFGANMSEEERLDLIKNISDKDERLASLNLNKARFKKFDWDKTDKQSAGSYKKEVNINVKKAKKAEQVERKEKDKLKKEFGKLTSKTLVSDTKKFDRRNEKVSTLSNKRAEFMNQIISNNSQITELKNRMRMDENSRSRHKKELEGLYKQEVTEESEKRISELQKLISSEDKSIASSRLKIRDFEKDNTKLYNKQNRHAGVSYTNKINKNSRKQLSAIYDQISQMSSLERNSKLSDAQRKVVEDRIRALQDARGQIEARGDVYFKARKQAKIPKEFSELTEKQIRKNRAEELKKAAKLGKAAASSAGRVSKEDRKAAKKYESNAKADVIIGSGNRALKAKVSNESGKASINAKIDANKANIRVGAGQVKAAVRQKDIAKALTTGAKAGLAKEILKHGKNNVVSAKEAQKLSKSAQNKLKEEMNAQAKAGDKKLEQKMKALQSAEQQLKKQTKKLDSTIKKINKEQKQAKWAKELEKQANKADKNKK